MKDHFLENMCEKWCQKGTKTAPQQVNKRVIFTLHAHNQVRVNELALLCFQHDLNNNFDLGVHDFLHKNCWVT